LVPEMNQRKLKKKVQNNSLMWALVLNNWLSYGDASKMDYEELLEAEMAIEIYKKSKPQK
jgi:hypothetical protein